MFTKKNVTRIFEIIPTIRGVLLESQNPKMARRFLFRHTEDLIIILDRDRSKLQPLEWELQRSCLIAFRRMISERSFHLTQFDLVELLWFLANEKFEELPATLSDGFFEEMEQLFKGMKGKSGVYDQELFPEYMRSKGRKAALLRSDFLDSMGKRSDTFTKRYSSGLDNPIIALRKKNKIRILRFFKGGLSDWEDYRWHMTHVIRDRKTLEQLVTLSNDEKNGIDMAKKAHLPFGITPYYIALMDPGKNRVQDHAVRAQVIPSPDYVQGVLDASANGSLSGGDFMLEHDTSPIDLVTRRYPHVAILKPFNTCVQICVYCQRNWEIDDVLSPRAMATSRKINEAIEWIKSTPSLFEVLVTGGDPLIMNDRQIEILLEKLSAIDHIERIRIGSRTPVVLPQRVTDSLVDIIARFHVPGKREIVLITHFEHPYEITPEAMEAIQKIRRRGISVYNQAVYTIENSRRFELVALRRKLRLIGVDPYYTFNTKGKEETRRIRVPMARLQQEIKEEARLVPGIVRTDEAVYNVPGLGKNYVRAQQNHTLLTLLPDGRRIYEFHPWEKQLSLAETFIDTDVSIHNFLNELEKRGEKREDYSTIWYYF